MKRRPLWQLSVVTTPEAEEAVGECLARLFGEPVSAYTDLEHGGVFVSLYSLTRPERSRCAGLGEQLDRLKTFGLRIDPGKISVRRLRPQDWAESWKRHFPPLEIGSTLLIKPGWSRRRARAGQHTIVADPGLSFGTGQHATTKFCLRQLVAARKRDRSQSFLDIGTGSGILAIAAAKLGYAPVTAFDFDPEAVRCARANARRNRVLDRIRLTRADLLRLPVRERRKHDVICANLLADLLVNERRRILERLKPAGTLILAGILEQEFQDVQRAYERAGLRLVAARTEKEWRSGAFRR